MALTPIASFELVERGNGTPDGVGAVRIFHTGWISSRERLVTVTPDKLFSYELVSSLAVRDDRAVVRLEPVGDSTAIHWRSTFRPKMPGTGWISTRQLGRFIGLAVNGLAAAAAAAESAKLAGAS